MLVGLSRFTVKLVKVLSYPRLGDSHPADCQNKPRGFMIPATTSIIAISVTKVQSSLRRWPWLLALSTPSGSQPDNRVYGKNSQFAIPSFRECSSAGLPASFGRMCWGLGRVEHPTSATPNNWIVGGVPFHAQFRQCGGGD